MRTLIRNGRVITAIDDLEADVLVDGETIAAIGPGLDEPADTVIDASGRYVIPGGIDPHTHFDLPVGPSLASSDDFATGTIAAAHGGTTTIIDFPTQERGHSLREAVDVWSAKAEGKAAIDYGFHVICTDLPDSRLGEMRALIDEGIPSFKLLMAYPGRVMVDDGTIWRAMELAGQEGGLILIHAESGHVIDAMVKRALAEGLTAPKYHALTRPVATEVEATARAIALAQIAGSPVYIVHLSSGVALGEIVEARRRGEPVFAETCPQYLFLDESVYDLEDAEAAKYVMSPPLRSRGNQELLWRGLEDDDLQLVATDHCPFTLEQKKAGLGDFTKIPNGGPSLEHRMSLVFDGGVRTGRIGLRRFVEITSTNAAKIFGMYPRKGTIRVGSDADLVIFDPEEEVTLGAGMHHMNVDYSAFEGMTVSGVPKTVMSRGEVIVDEGRFLGKPGRGRFLRRDRFTLE